MDHLDVVRREAARVQQLLRAGADLAAPVPSCGAWTAYDLVTHLGGVHRWATAATRTPPAGPAPTAASEPEGLDADALADWFEQGAAALLDALAVDPVTPCWTLAEPRVVGSWRRRQAHETTVHRWDLESALGLPATIGPDVAADAVDEVLTVLLPRQVRLGRLAASPTWVRLLVDGGEREVATGSDRDAEPLAMIEGAAADVLLVLWGRRGLGDGLGRVTVVGDVDAAAAFLRGALTP